MVKVTDKRAAILSTALKLLVEQGFHNTPMSQIAKVAGVSAGIIYHYFESKDELVHQLYHDIKAKISQALTVGEPDLLEGIETVRMVWFNAYNFYVANPQETIFLEQYENSPFNNHWEKGFDAKLKPIIDKLQKDIEAGLVVNLPIIVLYDLTFGVAMSLAKQQIAGLIQLDQAMLQQVAGAVVRAVQPL